MESKGSVDLHVGTLVERYVEDIWFTARITGIDDANQECSLSYIDDDWEETNVPFGDIRLLNADCKLVGEKVGRTSKLPKPLLGLIDDDSDKRYAHEPIVEVHRDSNTGISALR